MEMILCVGGPRPSRPVSLRLATDRRSDRRDLLARRAALFRSLRWRSHRREGEEDSTSTSPSQLLAACLAIASAGVLVLGLVSTTANECNLGPLDLARDSWHGGHGDPGILCRIATFWSGSSGMLPVAGKERVPGWKALSRAGSQSPVGRSGRSLCSTSIALIAGRPHLSLIAAPLLAALVCFLINVVAISRHWITGVRLPRPHVSAVHRPI